VKPSPFRYHAPRAIDEAVGVLMQFGDGARVLAGGQSLVPLLSLRLASFEHLVDLRHLDALTAVERIDGHVRVGAMVRQAVAERHHTITADVPLLAKALPLIGHFQIRNRGTVGGSIAHGDPAAELPAVALALDADIEVQGPAGMRLIAATNFFESMWQTTAASDEIVTAVRFPVWGGRTGAAVEEVSRRHGDFAICGAACVIGMQGDVVHRAAISMFGVGDTPVRATSAEQMLIGGVDDLAAVATEATRSLHPSDDIHASAGYRRHVAGAMVRRALTRAIEEARS
jgi:carbon-monoxide dehydrogenase medium subunit